MKGTTKRVLSGTVFGMLVTVVTKFTVLDWQWYVILISALTMAVLWECTSHDDP